MRRGQNCLRTTLVAAFGAAAMVSMTGAKPADTQWKDYQTAERLVTEHLAAFDTLDYTVFTYQQWARLHESHSQDVVVHWPDGHETHGLEKHIADLKAMFVYAPDTRIKTHSVKFGSGEWTCVIGVMEGTFTQPMPTQAGGAIRPTGKPFKITMCTVGHWKDGVMDEEYLFWDSFSFMQQIGLAP